VEVTSKQIFNSRAVPYNNGWLVTTDLTGFGEIHAFAETHAEIELMARQNICSFTDLAPGDFEVNLLANY
jgi:hypothetical protein